MQRTFFVFNLDIGEGSEHGSEGDWGESLSREKSPVLHTGLRPLRGKKFDPHFPAFTCWKVGNMKATNRQQTLTQRSERSAQGSAESSSED
eukprot:6463204-Amphidinium_carterae.2